GGFLPCWVEGGPVEERGGQVCQRLFEVGLGGELGASVPQDPPVDDPRVRAMGMGLGALEVWLLAKGYLGKSGEVELPASLLGQFEADLLAANKENSRVVGDEHNHN